MFIAKPTPRKKKKKGEEERIECGIYQRYNLNWMNYRVKYNSTLLGGGGGEKGVGGVFQCRSLGKVRKASRHVCAKVKK